MRSLLSIIFIAWAWICGLISLAHAGADTSMPAGSTLYAYGDGINGLPVFYADGKAYIGYAAPKGASEVMKVTFTLSNSTLYATPVTPTTANKNKLQKTSQMSTYIIPSASSQNAVGFAISTTATTKGAKINQVTRTAGFTFYGNQLAWVDDNGNVLQNCWAKPAADDQDDVYILIWNADNTAEEGSVPVLIEYKSW